MADTNNILSSWNSKKDDANNIKIKNLDNRVKKIEEYISMTDLNNYIKAVFSMQRTGRVFTSKFPLFSTSQSSVGIKQDDNTNMVCIPSTQRQKNRNDYENEPMFKPIECNWELDDNNGKIVLTSIEGLSSFSRDGSNGQVGIINMPWYVKSWKDDNYWYISVTDTPKLGYELLTECYTPTGEEQGFMVHSKYLMGDIDGKPYSASGLIPLTSDESSLNISPIKVSFTNLINYCYKHNNFYCAETNFDLFFIQLQFLIKYANLNMNQAVSSAGVLSYYIDNQTTNSSGLLFPSADTLYLPTYNTILSGSVFSNLRESSGEDYWRATIRDINLNSRKIQLNGTSGIIYAGQGAVSMPWKTGCCDHVLGIDGFYNSNDLDHLGNQDRPLLIGGIECFSGGREVLGNALVNLIFVQNSTQRDVRIYKANNLKNMSNPSIIGSLIYGQVEDNSYISYSDIDPLYSFIYPKEVQASSQTGFASQIFTDNITSTASVTREILCLYNSIWELDISRDLSNKSYKTLNSDGDSVRPGYNIVSRLSPNGMCQRPS